MKQTVTMAPSMNQNGENDMDHDFENLLTEIQNDNGLSMSPDLHEKKRKEANKSEAVVAPMLSQNMISEKTRSIHNETTVHKGEVIEVSPERSKEAAQREIDDLLRSSFFEKEQKKEPPMREPQQEKEEEKSQQSDHISDCYDLDNLF